jgi:hypothetical protein
MSVTRFTDTEAMDELAAWWHTATRRDEDAEVRGADLTDVVRRLLDRARPTRPGPTVSLSCPECQHDFAEHYGQGPRESYPTPRLCRGRKPDGRLCRCRFTKPSVVSDAPAGLGYRALPRLRLVRTGGRGHPRAEPVRSAQDVFDLFREDVIELEREYFWSLLLDGRNRLIGIDEVAVGSLTSTLVHPREVFGTAMLSKAAHIILVHNHPSGDPEPSSEDIALTTRLVHAGELLGIKILDHVVLGDGRFRSLSEEGRM